MEIKIGVIGRILNGSMKDWQVFIQDLDQGSGAYLILLSSPDQSHSYDDWAENFHHLQEYLQEANWQFQWVDNL